MWIDPRSTAEFDSSLRWVNIERKQFLILQHIAVPETIAEDEENKEADWRYPYRIIVCPPNEAKETIIEEDESFAVDDHNHIVVSVDRNLPAIRKDWIEADSMMKEAKQKAIKDRSDQDQIQIHLMTHANLMSLFALASQKFAGSSQLDSYKRFLKEWKKGLSKSRSHEDFAAVCLDLLPRTPHTDQVIRKSNQRKIFFEETFDLPGEELIAHLGCSMFDPITKSLTEGELYISVTSLCFDSPLPTEIIKFVDISSLSLDKAIIDDGKDLDLKDLIIERERIAEQKRKKEEEEKRQKEQEEKKQREEQEKKEAERLLKEKEEKLLEKERELNEKEKFLKAKETELDSAENSTESQGDEPEESTEKESDKEPPTLKEGDDSEENTKSDEEKKEEDKNVVLATGGAILSTVASGVTTGLSTLWSVRPSFGFRREESKAESTSAPTTPRDPKGSTTPRDPEKSEKVPERSISPELEKVQVEKSEELSTEKSPEKIPEKSPEKIPEKISEKKNVPPPVPPKPPGGLRVPNPLRLIKSISLNSQPAVPVKKVSHKEEFDVEELEESVRIVVNRRRVLYFCNLSNLKSTFNLLTQLWTITVDDLEEVLDSRKYPKVPERFNRERTLGDWVAILGSIRVASELKMKVEKFHRKFVLPNVEELLLDVNCSYLEGEEIPGKIQVSRRYLCFKSKVKGKNSVTLVISLRKVTKIEIENEENIPNLPILVFTTRTGPLFKFVRFQDHTAEDLLQRIDLLWNEVKSAPPILGHLRSHSFESWKEEFGNESESSEAQPKDRSAARALRRLKHSGPTAALSKTDGTSRNKVKEWVGTLSKGHTLLRRQIARVLIKDASITELVLQGIPNKLRARLWTLWSGARYKKAMSHGHYVELLRYYEGQGSDAINDLEKDLHRSFPDHPFYQSPQGIESLRNVLVAYSWRNPRVGYTQSMNFLVALLLTEMNEEDAFWITASVVEELLPDYYSPSMIGSIADHRVFEILVEKYLPEIHAHLQALNIPMQVLALSWFLALFITYLPLELSTRVLDCFFYESHRVVFFRVALAIFKLREKEVLSEHDSGTLIMNMKNYKATNRDLIQTALQDFQKVTPEMIDSLYAYYRYEVIQEMLKTTTKSRSMSLSNRKLIPPSLWSPDGTPKALRRESLERNKKTEIIPDPSPPTNEASYTICTLGISAGKSALIQRFISDKFDESDIPTVEETYTSEIVIGDTRVILNIVDTSGSDDYATIRSQWYTKSDAFVYVYSVASQESFDAIEVMHDEVEKSGNSVLQKSRRLSVLVGTQLDKHRVINRKQGKDLALKFECIFYETSAATGESVTQVFRKLAADLLMAIPDRVVPDTNGKRSRSNTM